MKCSPGCPTLILAFHKGSALVNLYVHLRSSSNIQVNILPRDLPSLRDLREVFDFFSPNCSDFYLLGQNEAAYMPDPNQRAQYYIFILQMMKLHFTVRSKLHYPELQ